MAECPLHLACKIGHYQTVETLLKHGRYDLNGTDDDGFFTPLMWACEYGHTDIAILLLSRGAQVNMQKSDGGSALMSTLCDPSSSESGSTAAPPFTITLTLLGPGWGEGCVYRYVSLEALITYMHLISGGLYIQ